MVLDMEIQKLKVLRDLHHRNKYEVERKLKKELPKKLEILTSKLEKTKEDIQIRDNYKATQREGSKIPFVIQGKVFENREEAGEAFTDAVKQVKAGETLLVGTYYGFEFGLKKDYVMSQVQLQLIVKGKDIYTLEAGESAGDNLQRIVNLIQKLDITVNNLREKIEQCKQEQVQLQMELEKPFAQEEEYIEKLSRQKELEVFLSQEIILDIEKQEIIKKNKKR